MLDCTKCTEQDLKVAANIERKRLLEEERKARIFDPRVRKIGIDKNFLDRQVEEKKRQRELEKERENRLDKALVRSSQLAILLEKQQDEERKKLNKEIDSFRKTHQKPELRREFDLYDPEQLKKTKPLRSSDDEDLGLASAQKFEGEDSNSANRRREQQEQMQCWIRQQMSERQMAERQLYEAERAYAQAVLSRENRAMQLERMERDCRRRLEQATAKFNLALAEEQEHRKRCLEAQEDEDRRAEIYNHVTGDFLTESKAQAVSLRGPHKPLASRYKGMTPDELKVFRDQQELQMQELQRLKMEENNRDEQWNQLMNGNAKAAESYQRELDRKRSELSKQIAEENRKLAEQQKSYQEYLNRHVYKHQPSEEFYAQFNKTTR